MDPIKSALNLFRRLPPEDVESTFHAVTVLREALTDELLQHIDFPLKVGYDKDANKSFIISDFNCNGDSYRSPWTNKYFPPSDNGFFPNRQLRHLEEIANFLFEKYTEMYYDQALSSVYLWDSDSHICGCFLIMKEVLESPKQEAYGSWHSIHLVEVIPDISQKKAEYRLTSSIQLYLTIKGSAIGVAKQNGTLTRQASAMMAYSRDEDHVANVGQMIEEMENFVRSNLDTLYMSKNQETVDTIRILHPSDLPKRSLLAELSGKLKPRME